MLAIHLTTLINAPVEICFDLSRSIDLHLELTKHTGEQAVAGTTSGLIGLGEWVTWRAKHFGIAQELTSKVTEFDRPNYFVDEQVSGAFEHFRHEHRFTPTGKSTIMEDKFTFESPFGLAGKLFNKLVLTRYMTNLLITRNKVIKKAAEATTTSV